MAAKKISIRALCQIMSDPNEAPKPAGTILTEEDLPKKELVRLVTDGAAEFLKSETVETE